MKLIPYIRVSGLSQADGDGPVRQFCTIEAFARQKGATLLPSIEDLGVSGTTDHTVRPGLFAALEQAAQQGAGICVERLDRIARDIVVQEKFFAAAHKAGISVWAADTGQDYIEAAQDP